MFTSQIRVTLDGTLNTRGVEIAKAANTNIDFHPNRRYTIMFSVKGRPFVFSLPLKRHYLDTFASANIRVEKKKRRDLEDPFVNAHEITYKVVEVQPA